MQINCTAEPRIAVVVGSNRPRRICDQIAAWVQRALRDAGLGETGLIDLQEIGLPFLDEPDMPAHGRYEHEHTIRWSALISSYDGFVFVFPQYNWGYPAVLKNALDFLYDEWSGKPAGLVTYGTRGGGLAAAQLEQVLQGLHMRPTETNVELKTDSTMLTDAGRLRDGDAVLAGYRPQVTALATELRSMAKATRPDPSDAGTRVLKETS
jgi:NAD(P)H-dependent FMN reductase